MQYNIFNGLDVYLIMRCHGQLGPIRSTQGFCDAMIFPHLLLRTVVYAVCCLCVTNSSPVHSSESRSDYICSKWLLVLKTLTYFLDNQASLALLPKLLG